ncbi:MAG: DNA-directed RNA polymerase subunit beta' [Candidatus Cloacimonadota bacterium]|nr:MAG: DNA-directed RNA polymerase subunit beta' [Candidatus Cloacimonadota bacterium]
MRYKNVTPKEFDFIKIRLASPETIKSWSHGEVTKPETINYRTQKPEKDGLFCERIFGPVKDYECSCGKYKHVKYRGVVCERCGVEVTLSKVRRERMGHIELAVPVAHIWFYKTIPSRISYLLGISPKVVQRVLYYESYAVIDPQNTPLKKGELVSESEFSKLSLEYPDGFVAKMGAEGIFDLLIGLDLDEISAKLKSYLKIETSIAKRKSILKRLKITEAFRLSKNKPEWMILRDIPVIPPDLRPLVPLEGGRFATSDLNDLYRRVITRNNRLKNLIEIKAPDIILRNEKRMLQEAVDALLDNTRRSRPIKGRGNRPLKSLSDALKGKQGRFRQNLLGKRTDYSGRSVIVVDPTLKLEQCGLPKIMALELFKPFIIRKLEQRGYAQSVKGAKRLLYKKSPEVWNILEEIVTDHPVLLNRAPTLHRLGIQAFNPVLVEGKAIRIHPLVCVPYNADFDGDQMAVHIPLSFEAQLESVLLMLSSNNILSPANGKPLVSPTQEIVVGCYYLTKEKENGKGENKAFSDAASVSLAIESGALDLHSKIITYDNGKRIETTAGRMLFNEIIPEGFPFVNTVMDKGKLAELVSQCFWICGNRASVEFLDRLKELGFEYATRSGLTIGIDDIITPPEKQGIIQHVMRDIKKEQSNYEKGIITDSERYNRIIDLWTDAIESVENVLITQMSKDREGFNPIHIMSHSGAKGSTEQVRQLGGMRGLMTRPQKKITGQIGEIIETPILNNFKDGLTVLEYFISTHGSRKGLTDTALKTAEAGYLTRRLVDVAQDVIITEEDCNAVLGLDITALKEGEKVIEPLSDRIEGRFVLEDVIHPFTNEVMIKADEEVTSEKAKEIEKSGIQLVKIRSVLTCEAKRGLCRKCYGRNLSTGNLIEIGEAIGVIAAQSIGEPGTQLTLKTFHIGGTATRISEQSEIESPYGGKITYKDLRYCTNKDNEKVVTSRNGYIVIQDEQGKKKTKMKVPYGAIMKVNNGVTIENEDVVFSLDPYSTVIICEQEGKIKFIDIIENVTMVEELDTRTQRRQQVIVESREKGKMFHPQIDVVDKNGKNVAGYSIPIGAYLLVRKGKKVYKGDVLVKIPKEIRKTRDITGGLPRVAELFEARIPGNAAIISEIDGTIRFGPIKRGERTIFIVSETKDEREYKIPYGRHLIVHDGEKVQASDKLCDGPINPHDILAIKGTVAAMEYLRNEIQEVYRLQGVKIDDKHIGVIVRQMLQKILIDNPGNTGFIEGDFVEKWRVNEENRKIMQEGGKPAVFKPLLLGITKAAISTESFISAASFQETTRVLTDAAVRGKRDDLLGLKENVIVGNLIPAGTGIRKYIDMELVVEEEEIEEEEVIKDESGLVGEDVRSEGSVAQK